MVRVIPGFGPFRCPVARGLVRTLRVPATRPAGTSPIPGPSDPGRACAAGRARSCTRRRRPRPWRWRTPGRRSRGRTRRRRTPCSRTSRRPCARRRCRPPAAGSVPPRLELASHEAGPAARAPRRPGGDGRPAAAHAADSRFPHDARHPAAAGSRPDPGPAPTTGRASCGTRTRP